MTGKMKAKAVATESGRVEILEVRSPRFIGLRVSLQDMVSFRKK